MSEERMTFLKPAEFQKRISEILTDLKPKIQRAIIGCEIEHIGSSSIAGAISKGDLDILVRVQPRDLEQSVQKIESLGFQIKLGTLRTPSLCMLETSEYKYDVAVQLIARGSEFEFFVIFRDKLNGNAELVDRFNEMKINSIGLTPEEYRSRKSKFIEKVLSES